MICSYRFIDIGKPSVRDIPGDKIMSLINMCFSTMSVFNFTAFKSCKTILIECTRNKNNIELK